MRSQFAPNPRVPLTRAVDGRCDAAGNRVLIVDDHGILRDGLALFLEQHANLKVVGSVATGEEAVLAARRLTPDLIVMDLMLPLISGIDATREILGKNPHVRIIALSGCRTPEQVSRAFNAGVCGYVLKGAVGDELLGALRQVQRGRRYISPAIADLIAADSDGSAIARNPLDRLSHRECEVLRHVAEGASSAEIARALSLSRKTVDTYRARMMIKLGAPNRSALIRIALQFQLTSQ